MENNNFNSDMENNVNFNARNIKKKKKATTKQKVWMAVWIVLFVFVLFELVKLGGYTLGKVDKDKMHLYNGLNKIMSMFVSKHPNQTTEEKTLKVAGLGDIYVTPNMLNGAKTKSGYDFTEGTSKVAEKLKGYDFVLASLATPVVEKSLGYSTTKNYGAPTELVDLLKTLQVSAVATATSHAMDKNEKGITQTIANLKEQSIQQVGLNEESRTNPIVLSKNDISIGIVSYATSSNVKMTSKQASSINMLEDGKLKDDIKYLKDKKVDFIIAYLYCPNVDSLMVNGDEKTAMDTLFTAGVHVVFGGGSMVVQEDVEDQLEVDGSVNHIYGIYSLGDFMGGYQSTDSQLSVIGNLEFNKKITKNKKGEVVKTEADFKVKKPIGLWTEVDKKYGKTIYILEDAISDYNNENTNKFTAKQYHNMKEANERIEKLFQ